MWVCTDQFQLTASQQLSTSQVLLIGAWQCVKMSKRGEQQEDDENTNLLAVILCELGEESASLLGLEISQHGGDDGADMF